MRISASFLSQFLLALGAAASSAAIEPDVATYSLFEELPGVPPGWTELSQPVDQEKTLSMRIMLTPQNVDRFQQRVVDLSTPDHPNYGSHMSPQQIQHILQPQSDAAEAVFEWLVSNGLQDRVESRYDSFKFVVTVAEAEQLLQAQYRYFRNEENQKTILRTLAYSIPEELHAHVALVQPTTMFGMQSMKSTIRKMEKLDIVKQVPGLAKATFNTTDCNKTIDLGCLQNLYNFAGHKSSGRGSIGITGYLEQAAILSDLTAFLDRYSPGDAAANFTVASVNGGRNPQNGTDEAKSGEANLDVQYAVGISNPTPATYFTTAGRPPAIPDVDGVADENEPYLEFLNYILDQEEIPDIISTSYGENEQTVPLSYRLVTCNMFAQLGARGVSVIFSSGDSGPGQGCVSNDGLNRTIFTPIYPAGCPFVTSVGSTHNIKPEKAAYFSSGGFSDTWARPAYQDAAVQNYFESTDTYTPFLPYFNETGRGTPDVSLQGVAYDVFIFGDVYRVDGTSASAPAFAGIVALLNDLRLQRGDSALGFLNPWLYSSAAAAFNDITVGRSVGCTGKKEFGKGELDQQGAVIPNAGWDAVPGWDPVTGLGTPDFLKLLDVI